MGLPHSMLDSCILVHACVLSCFSRVQLFSTIWTAVRQAPLSVGFSRQEYWSGLACSPPENLPDPGIKPRSPASPALAAGFFITSTTWEALIHIQFNSVQSLAAAAKSLQSCPTLCDSIDSSPPGSPIPGILQARTLEWVAVSFSYARK